MFRSGWCNSNLVDHSRCREGYENKAGNWIACVCDCHKPLFYAVFWTDARDGLPQMDADWADRTAVEKYAHCLEIYNIASTSVPVEIREYRGECPW